MSSLFGGQAGRTPNLNPADALARKEQIMNEVKQQLAVANAQQLISTMNEKCYARCILKPAATLSPNDEGCISRCSDRFLEAFDLVSKTYIKRIQTERDAANI